jgi:hypothetical protein
MKKFMITGGLIGFLIGIVSGVVQRSEWPSVIGRASVAALAAGLLLRWWGRVWAEGLHQADEQPLARKAKAQELSAPIAS